MPAQDKYLKTTALAALLALSAGGCSLAPERDAQNTNFVQPEAWTSGGRQGTGQPVTAWLAVFGDAQLTALVRDGLDANFDLHAAAARVDAAREQAVIAGAERWPQLFFLPVYQRGEDHNGAWNGFSARFDLSWEIDVWGRIKAAQQAAVQDADAAAGDFRAAQLSLAARVAQTYFELTEARLQAEVAAQSVKDRGVIVDLVQGRFNKGLTRGLDLSLVLTDRANAEAQLAQARNAVQSISRRLQTLLGRYPDDGLQTVGTLPEPPSALTAGLPAELLARRPDLSAAFQRLRAADSRLESANKALLPRISLTAGGGAASAALGEMLDPRMAAWNFATGLLQPIFTGGRLQGEIRFNAAETRAAFNQYQSAALNAFREVEQALAAETWLRTQEQALRAAVAQTEASRKLAVYSYRQGLIEILTLLDSYRSTLSAQSAHLAAQRQLLHNRIDLYLALGGAVE